MQDALYPTLSSSLGMAWANEGSGTPIPARTGNRHGGLAECPYNVYPTADGAIAILCVGDGHWRALAGLMERADLGEDPRYTDLRSRVSRMDEVDALVGAWTATQATEALFATLMANRIPCAPVRTLAQVMNDPNMHARGALQWIDHPQFGRLVVQASPFRFSGLPPHPLEPSRSLGADTAAVLAERLGMSDAEIAAVAP